jgi:hypothetical protein
MRLSIVGDNVGKRQRDVSTEHISYSFVGISRLKFVDASNLASA